MAHFIYPTQGKTSFLRDGVTTLPTLDNAVPANDRGMPVVLLAGDALGPVDVNAGAAGTKTLRVVLSSDSTISIEEDKNYGIVGANTIRTAAQIGNATGAAEFGSGADSAQTLRVTTSTRSETATTPLAVRLTDGTAFLANLPVSQSGTWNINNISGTISLPTGAATEATMLALSNKVANDFGVATAAVRVASQVGNATGAADFGSGADSAQTLRVTLSTRAESATTPLAVRQSDGTVLYNGASESTLGSANVKLGNIQTYTQNLNGKTENDFNGSTTIAIRTAAILGNAGGVASFGAGAISAQTLRVALADESKVQVGLQPVSVISRAYATTNATGTYSNLGSALGAAGNMVAFFETGGSPLIIGWGGVDKFIVPPGGSESPLPVAIPNGTQLQIKTADASTVSSGNFYMTVLG